MTATAVREKPILFTTEMVRAILHGRKTMTRRILKPRDIPSDVRTLRMENQTTEELTDVARPPYPVGTRLWVRETWASAVADGVPCFCYKADLHRWYPPYGPNGFDYEKYPAEYINNAGDLESGAEGTWKPSIHIKKWAARLWLEVTAVKVERVQDITETDAIAEGAFCWAEANNQRMERWCRMTRRLDPAAKGASQRGAFALLWESINGPGAWARNDWVFAYTFKKIDESQESRT